MSIYFIPIALRKDSYPIIISGNVPFDADRFTINFTTGSQPFPNYEIGLHMSVRFDENAVVLSSYLPGSGWREKKRSKRMPFARGVAFGIIVKLGTSWGKNFYEININGKHFYNFPEDPKIPIREINYLSITGHVNIIKAP